VIAAGRALGVLLPHDAIDNFFDVVEGNLLVDTLLAHNLYVVLFAVFAEQEAEAARADILPAVLLVKPVQLGSVLLR